MTAGTKDTPVIVFVIRYFHPFIGGLEKKTLNLASDLIKRGVCVEIITSRFYPAWPDKDLVKNVPVFRLPLPASRLSGLLSLSRRCAGIFLNKGTVSK